MFSAGAALAGDLNPPGGPVTSTLKDLVEVEPRIALNQSNTPGDGNHIFVISQPGSYYLTDHVVDLDGMNAIDVTVSDVTIDLNGFTLLGGPDSGDGIVSISDNLTVLNGRIVGWVGGVGLFGGENLTVLDVHVIGSGGNGIHCTTDDYLITRCVADGNAGVGIVGLGRGRIEHCNSSGNGSHGIEGGPGAVISHCLLQQNMGDGIHTAGGVGSQIVWCVSRLSGGDGIECGGDAFVAYNLCERAAGDGIRVSGNHCLIDSNLVTNTSPAINVLFSENIIVRNFSASNGMFPFTFAANNTFGPSITGPGEIMTSNPWSNIVIP